MSTQRTCIEQTADNGWTWKKAKRNAENAIKLKSLFIDLDWKGKENNSYDTQKEAVTALGKFLRDTSLPMPSMFVSSGGGLHIYFVLAEALPVKEWRTLAHSLAEATRRFGLKCDVGCTVDAARVLRIAGTWNCKLDQKRQVRLAGARQEFDYSVERIGRVLEPSNVAAPRGNRDIVLDPTLLGQLPAAFHGVPVTNDLSAGLEREDRTYDLDELTKECAFLHTAVTTGGKDFNNPQWNLTNLIATFTDGQAADAHRMGDKHPEYNNEVTDEQFERKLRERGEKGLGFPLCQSIHDAGFSGCRSCPHFERGRSPLAALPHKVTPPPEEPSFADPYGDFVGPSFPISILPSVLADFVEAERQAMGADPAALAMGALSVVAGALHAKSKVQLGDGWFERPILWTMFVGSPSTKKSPLTYKAMSPLSKIDADRSRSFAVQLQQAKAAGAKGSTLPPKLARCVLQDATPEKVAENSLA